MKFKTFLEQYDWFDNSIKVGTSYLNPTKRDKKWLSIDKFTPQDKAYFTKLVESHPDADQLKQDIDYYKRSSKQTKLLADFVSKCKLNRDYVVYRTFGGTVDVSKLRVGSVIANHNVLAGTSLSYHAALTFTGKKNTHILDDTMHNWVCRIVLKKGQNGFSPDALGGNHNIERELIITKSPKVVGFSYVDLGSYAYHTIDCKV